MSDRYVFARVGRLGTPYHATLIAAPAPSPEDWQAIVDAEAMGYNDELLGACAREAVRNMREAQQ